jgi:hypothetical protein
MGGRGLGRRGTYRWDGKEQTPPKSLGGIQAATKAYRCGKSLAAIQLFYGFEDGAMSCNGRPEADCVTDLKMGA